MITPEKLKAMLDSGDPQNIKLIQLYLTDEYYKFKPRPDAPHEFDEQKSFVESVHDGIVCCVAGNASGKSYAAAFKVAHFLRTNEAPSDLCKFFVASQSLQMCGLLWQEKLSKFIPQGLIESIQWFNSKENHPKTIIMKPGKNGNRWMLSFRSYEQGRKSFQAASQVAGFWCDEQIGSMNLLSELDTRTREYSYKGSKIYTLTPLEPDEELQERFENPDKYPYWKFYRQNAEKNYEAGGISNLQWLENTPDDMKETRRIGDFAQFSGAIFKEFDSKTHVISPIALDKHTKYYRVFDWGYAHDTCCLLIAVTDKGIMYVVKEWFGTGMLIADKVKAIQLEMPESIEKNFGDGEDAQQRAEFGKLGIHITVARKEPVTYGIELVRRKFATKQLFVFDNCKKLISQIKNYRWKEPKEGGEQLIKEKPIKRNDDGCDSLRMCIHSLERNDLTAWQAATKIDQQRRI